MSPRFRHLLVPVDFAPKNQAALEAALEFASATSAKVTLLHVIERIDVSEDDEETASFYDELQQRAAAEFERQAQQFLAAGLAAEFELRFGRRVEEIVRSLSELKADLVILASHQVDAAEPVRSLNSLSYQVSMLATCPVMLVK